MAPQLVKVGRLWIEILSYTNAREWIRKVTAYLKGEDYWAPIETVIEERKAQDSDKAPENTDSPPEKSILKHQGLTGKQLENLEKKDWQKANYQAISILLFIISISDQQTVENLKYAGDIQLYIMKKYIKANYLILTAAFANYFRWEKNEAQFIKKAAREIKYLAN